MKLLNLILILSFFATSLFASVSQGDSYRVSSGSLFRIYASDIGLQLFTKKPRVYALVDDKKVHVHLIQKQRDFKDGVLFVDCRWVGTKASPGTYSLYLKNKDDKAILVSKSFSIMSPDGGVLSQLYGSGREQISLSGDFFGDKKAKLWFELEKDSNITKKNCKILKPFEFPDFNGRSGKSMMSLRNGYSRLRFTVPSSISLGEECELWFENSLGTFSIPFNTLAIYSSITEYQTSRVELETMMEKESFDYGQELSDKEKEFDEYLRSLKNQIYDLGTDMSFYSARNFLTVREEIEKTDLFELVRKMPKGGILHIHEKAMGDFKWLVDEVTYRSNCYIYNGDSSDYSEGALAIFDSPPASSSWTKVVDDRVLSGDATTYDQKLLDSIVMTGQGTSLSAPRDKLVEVCGVVDKLFQNLEFCREYYLNAFKYLIEVDQVNHVEIRHFISEDHLKLIKEIESELDADGYFFDIRIIFYEGRSKKTGESDAECLARIKSGALKTADLMLEYPELLIGFDLVGDEDSSCSLGFFAKTLVEINAQLKSSNMTLPYFFHAGESTWSPDNNSNDAESLNIQIPPFNNNLYDAFLLDSSRVGHALVLSKSLRLMDEFKDSGTVIELCPISNQVFAYVDDLRNHPAVPMMNGGICVTVNPDYPSAFGYQGVTHDFWEACVAWNLDLEALKQLAENSIKHSALPETKKLEHLAYWRKKWYEFIDSNLKSKGLKQ